MILRLAAILLLTGHCAFGQLSDSVIVSIAPLDTILQRGQSQLDSIRQAAASRFAILKSSYDSVINIADEQAARISAAMDSLEGLALPSGMLQARQDSIRRWKEERISSIAEKVAKLKRQVAEKVEGLGLPPTMEEKGKDLMTAIDQLDVSHPWAELPAVFPEGTVFQLRGGVYSLDKGLPGVDGEHLGIAEGHITGMGERLPSLPPSMEDASAMAEEEAAKWVDAGGATESLSDPTELKQAVMLSDEQVSKEAIEEEVRKQAIDHFQGKEEQLEKAMETLAKYKQKYSKLEGLDQIPKKRPNPMRGKTFMERIVPGIALQVHRKDAWMVDFNLYAGYRFNERLRAGFGWNQRVGYDADRDCFDPHLRVFGPRLFAEFAAGGGFSARVEPEYMNARKLPRAASGHADADDRQWVYSTMAGIKKEYRFIGNVKGTMMLLYNMHDHDHRSPYAEKLIVRFGFEFGVKRRAKTKIERHLQ